MTTRKTNKPASLRLQPITFADLFAGIGGFHWAFALAGATLAWACEFDADAARIRPPSGVGYVQAASDGQQGVPATRQQRRSACRAGGCQESDRSVAG